MRVPVSNSTFQVKKNRSVLHIQNFLYYTERSFYKFSEITALFHRLHLCFQYSHRKTALHLVCPVTFHCIDRACSANVDDIICPRIHSLNHIRFPYDCLQLKHFCNLLSCKISIHHKKIRSYLQYETKCNTTLFNPPLASHSNGLVNMCIFI